MSCVRLNLGSLVPALLASASFTTWSQAQEVSIPDPGLNAAIREARQKPAGPLPQLDMLGLTNLSAIFRNITSEWCSSPNRSEVDTVSIRIA